MTRTLLLGPLAGALLAFSWLLPAQSLPSSPAATGSDAVATLAEAQRALDRGHPDQALAALDKLSPGPGRDRLRGAALYALSRFSEAQTALAAAVAANPADASSVQLRGLSLFRLGRPVDAIPLLEQAHTWTTETRVDPTYVLALCYIDTHRYDDARHAFAEQYGFPPDSAPAHLLAARMLFRREFVPTAQAEAEKAVALDATLPLAHRLLGEIALAGAHLEEAIAEFEKERQRNPLDGVTYDRLGDAYSRKGDYPAAQQMLDRALLLEPASTGPYILLGKVLLKRGDPASAAGYLERAQAMDPANYMTHSLLGQAYRSLGRTDDARRQADLSQKLQSDAGPKLESLH